MDLSRIVDLKDTHIKDRVLTDPQFVPIAPDDTKLADRVIVYNDGRKWKVININDMCIHPIIYDKYYDDDKKTEDRVSMISDISITFCPFTYCAVVYFDKYTLADKVNNGNIILINKDGGMMSQMLGQKFIRKKEVRIMTLRNVVSHYPDCSYFDGSKLDKIKRLTDESYLTNSDIVYQVDLKSDRFHPKTLVYSIEYQSKDVKHDSLKYRVIVSKDAAQSRPNSFDFYKDSNYAEYFEKWMDKIREKGGIIIPCFWFGWYAAHGSDKLDKDMVVQL